MGERAALQGDDLTRQSAASDNQRAAGLYTFPIGDLAHDRLDLRRIVVIPAKARIQNLRASGPAQPGLPLWRERQRINLSAVRLAFLTPNDADFSFSDKP